MNNSDLAKKLSSLAQLDVDAAHAYSQAIDEVDIPSVREHLSKYRNDHDLHYSELSTEIRKLGAEPPEYSRSFKGFLIEGFTSVRSATGTKGALEAMETNERLTNRKYQDATTWDVPAQTALLIRKNYQDEQTHLQFIRNALADRVWEKEKHAVA